MASPLLLGKELSEYMQTRSEMNEIANCWRSAQVNDTGLLIEVSDYYRAFCQATESAESYILLSGWQFDSDVQLLRQSDAEQCTLIALLNRLCGGNQNLRAYILAWNLSVLYCIAGGAAENESWIITICPDGLPLDRAGPVFGEDAYERMPLPRGAFFPRDIHWLTNFPARGIG